MHALHNLNLVKTGTLANGIEQFEQLGDDPEASAHLTVAQSRALAALSLTDSVSVSVCDSGHWEWARKACEQTSAHSRPEYR